ncbi:MAG: serine/threonine protein kinase, partial [Nannocystis sp.]
MPVRTEVPWGDTVPEPRGPAPTAAPVPSTAPGTSPGTSPGSDDPADPFIGRVIDDRYRIIERLGEGGMGTVYVAEHLKLRKQVAIKTILAEFASNPQIEARFAREALATAQLDHPHVASALDYGHFPEGGAYLVIQLVRGVTLARHLDTQGRLPWALAVELGAQIADALAAAHAAGVVHRDLKPDNILLEPRDDGRFHAKVVDFGIARLSEEPAAPTRGVALTRIGAILGTPGYMAPEQAVGQPVDARGDLYALGVILWECCIGRRLWQGESVNELVACQLRSTAPTLQQELGSRVPEALSELVAQLLSNAPSKRPDAATPVRDTLRRLAQSTA